jgi:hypothetical protein
VFLSQKSPCFELHFDLFREKSAGRGAEGAVDSVYFGEKWFSKLTKTP